MGRSRNARVGTPLGAVLVLLLTCAVAAAAAPERGEYVERLDSICKSSGEATQRAMKGSRADIRANRLKIAASKFKRASVIFDGSLKRMEAVPTPTADSTKLGKWFGYLDRQGGYLREAAAQLQAEDEVKAQRLVARFIHSGNLANNAVLSFGFKFCTFKYSRYG